MYFADCPKCGKSDSSHNGFDPCAECKQKQEEAEREKQWQENSHEQLQLLEVSDDDRS